MGRGSGQRRGAPGILDVAARAGVSGATVSRAFTRPASVAPATRERVRVAARELGYIRNRLASGLHSRRSGTVGLVVPTIDNAIFAELIEAFSRRLGEHDRTMLIASHDYDPAREVAIVRSLLERRIDGLALIGRDHDPAVTAMLALRGVPVVALWSAGGPGDVVSIGTDNREAARRVTEHLVGLGHRDVALLFPAHCMNDRAEDRLAGALAALRTAGLGHRLIECPYDMLAAKERAIELLDGARPPTAVIGGNDVIAQGVLHAARRRGVDVPGALSVVGIGDFKGSAAIEPGLTTVRLPARRIGALGADALVDRLASGAPDAVSDVVIDCALVARASTAAPAVPPRPRAARR